MAYKYKLEPKKSWLYLAEQVQKEDVSEGGIYLPTSSQKKKTALVVAYAGPDCKEYKPGDIVIPDARKCVRGNVGDKAFIVVKEKDITGHLKIVEGTDAEEG